MTGNPYRRMVPMLARRRPPVETEWLWAEVTQLSPLRVRFAGDDAAPDVTPLRIRAVGDDTALKVGSRVLVMHQGTQTTVIGPTALAPQPAPAVGSWTALTLASPWTNYSAFGNLSARVENGAVRLAGVVQSGTGGSGQPITTLPTGFRPASSRILLAQTGNGPVSVYAVNTGSLYLPNTLSTTAWVSLEGLTFRL